MSWVFFSNIYLIFNLVCRYVRECRLEENGGSSALELENVVSGVTWKAVCALNC